ncbi:MAG: hypothetical protein A3H50_00485 [Candidatus Levybacteria bacterium RIFCSPLOWO2_02_FULL_37_10]|nr:MAG: hypothetical protein A3H50_00485 [Candidatus Levybacteria bacterium RIFCSPLOWO2_02_FULL_37_10]
MNGFTDDQLKRFANILDNIGQVILATVVLPYLFIEKDSVVYSLIGFFVATLSWWLSLRVERITS